MSNVQEKMSNVQGQMANAMERVGEAAHNVGQKVSDFFQGNPFETAVGRKIELATDASKLATENWGLNMEICDFINCTNEGPHDAIRAIKKRLQTQMGKNNATVMYTLTVLETCVKNCDVRFTTLVCQKDFVAELVKLISAKYDAPQIVQERVLGLIQSWSDAFRENPALVGVVEMYDELKSKGVEFPPTDMDSMAPIITPKQTVFSTDAEKTTPPAGHQTFPSSGTGNSHHPQQQQEQVAIQSPTMPIHLSPEQMAKLRSELDLVNVNMQVLREIVAQMKPTAGNNASVGNGEQHQPEDFHFVQELYATCKEMQKRILDLIPVVTNEEVTFELLSINDELNTSFEKYDRCMANFNAQGIDMSMIPSGSGTAIVKTTTQSKQPTPPLDLIDLGQNAGGNGKQEAPSLDKQLQAIDLHANSAVDNGETARGGGANNESFVHDQAEVGIHAVAFNKPEPNLASSATSKDAKKQLDASDDGL